MTICLFMIVKNEGPRLPRCLASVKPFITHYVICDTGSTDDTIAVARQALEGIPGEVYEDRWVNFGHNRNLSLERCVGHGTWALTIDADQGIIGPQEPLPLDPAFDGYYCRSETGASSYWVRRIVKNDGSFHYLGKTHEVLVPKNGQCQDGRLDNHLWMEYADGHRRVTGMKYLGDAIILEEEIRNNPNDARSLFYLAQTYQNMGCPEKALENYIRRVMVGGWPEEVYYSMYQIAMLRYGQERSIWPVINDFMTAWHYRPHRLEALTTLCRLLREEKAWPLIYQLAAGKSQPTQDILFVDPVAEWLIIEEHALAAFYLEQKVEAGRLFASILAKYQLDADSEARVRHNLSLCAE